MIQADCGAGIGRVTKNFLLSRFQHVDLVERSPRLLGAAPEYVGANKDRITCILSGLQVTCVYIFSCPTPKFVSHQDFLPQPGRYDVIWIQWVIGHLHDMDCIAFFRNCITGLKPSGVICLKVSTLLRIFPLYCFHAVV